MKLNKQKYWQYVAEEVVDTGKRKIITDGFIADFDPSGVDKSRCGIRALKNPRACKNLKGILKRCANIETEREIGRASYDEDYGYNGMFLCSFKSGVKVQRKFVEYFTRLYPDCQFVTNPLAKYYYCVAVYQNNHLVGGIAGVNKLCGFVPTLPDKEKGKDV